MRHLKNVFFLWLPILFSLILPASPDRQHNVRKRHTPFLPGDYWKGMRPDFGDTETDVKVMVNGTARLKCPIGHVADSSISFLRKKDFHILSNGHHVYTRDKRFEVIHKAKSDDWILQISSTGFNDSGIYECQVSTSSGSHSLVFQLSVEMPRARILGQGSFGEFHLLKGSTITLVCIVEGSQAPQYVFWYHGARMINYDGFIAEGSTIMTSTAGSDGRPVTKSELTISNANPKFHSGNYTCKPSNAIATSVQLFVSEDRQSEPLLRPDAKDLLETHLDTDEDHRKTNSRSGILTSSGCDLVITRLLNFVSSIWLSTYFIM